MAPGRRVGHHAVSASHRYGPGVATAETFDVGIIRDAGSRSPPRSGILLTGGLVPLDAFLVSFGAMFVAELGDKTMPVTITLATTAEPWGTRLGSTLGMVAADAIAIGVGAWLGSRLPERAIKVVAAVAFVAFGIALVAEGLGVSVPVLGRFQG